jgi:cytochrome P450
MMSALLAAEITEDDGSSRKLTDAEAVAFIKLLSSAGNETTAKLIGWIGSSLAKFPGERGKLVKHPELIPNAVEEILRYEPPRSAWPVWCSAMSSCMVRSFPKGGSWSSSKPPPGVIPGSISIPST